MNLPAEIPRHLHQQAIPLGHLSVNEVAWTRDDAFEIIRVLERTDTAILGGDVLHKQGGNFTHNYDNWCSDRKEHESWSAYAARSRQEARAYLETYPDPQEGSIVFVLVFGAER